MKEIYSTATFMPKSVQEISITGISRENYLHVQQGGLIQRILSVIDSFTRFRYLKRFLLPDKNISFSIFHPFFS